MPLHLWMDDPENDDYDNGYFIKLILISLDKSSSSQNEWNDRKLLMNWQE